MERDFEGSHNFSKGKPHKRNHDFGDRFERKKQYREKQETYNFGNNQHQFQTDSNVTEDYFTQVPKPKKPRKYTLSMAVPASILDATSIKDELRTYVVGQIARAAVIYSVDEIIVYDDGCWGNESSSSDQQKNSQQALEKMRILLEYQELPPYLRKYFFGFDKNLRCVGLLNPLNSSHHLKANEWCDYREGVIMKKSKNYKSYVDVGLSKYVLIDEQLEPGLRVTVKLPLVAQEMDDSCGASCGTVVPPEEPRLKGYYWGYSVRIAKTLSEVVTGSKYQDGYDLIIGTSDKGDDARKIEFPKFSHGLIVFGGVEGLEAAVKSDSQLQASEPRDLFNFYVNTCSNQQVRTIRTEEAVLISLCVLHDKFTSKKSKSVS